MMTTGETVTVQDWERLKAENAQLKAENERLKRELDIARDTICLERLKNRRLAL